MLLRPMDILINIIAVVAPIAAIGQFIISNVAAHFLSIEKRLDRLDIKLAVLEEQITNIQCNKEF